MAIEIAAVEKIPVNRSYQGDETVIDAYEGYVARLETFRRGDRERIESNGREEQICRLRIPTRILTPQHARPMRQSLVHREPIADNAPALLLIRVLGVGCRDCKRLLQPEEVNIFFNS